MNAIELRDLLLGKHADLVTTLSALKNDILTPTLERMNNETLLFRYSLFKDQVIRTNQRNLTDVRTRMGTLLEYEFARALQEFIDQSGIDDVYVSYVIANQFPDLEVRGHFGEPGIRLELKALETVAEEKSANFDTLIKDIKKGTDFVIVLVWEWTTATRSPDISRPFVQNFFVFDAYDLAQMRDCYWLNRPPKSVGDGRQGYDFCFGVNCREGNYNEEEGNYGKLMRIFTKDYEKYLPKDVRAKDTLKSYYDFRNVVGTLGFQAVMRQIAGAVNGSLEILSSNLPIVYKLDIPGKPQLIFYGDHELVPINKIWDKLVSRNLAEPAYLIRMNNKFDWRAHAPDKSKVDEGAKPGQIADWIARTL